MNIDEIRKISLVEFLNQLGYQPTGRDSKGLWFYSPTEVSVSPRSMSIHGKICGLTSERARVATSSRLPEKCPVKRTFEASRLYR